MIRSPLSDISTRDRALLAHSSDVILVVDADGRITFESPSATRILGHPEGTLAGFRVGDLVHPDDRRRALKLGQGLLRRRGRALITCRVRRGDGGWMPTESRCEDRRDDPTIGGVIVSLRDISDRLALQEQLQHRSMHDHLTGLPNRHMLRDRLSRALQPSRLATAAPGLIVLDLAGLADINARHGHEVGDHVLRVVAARLRALASPEDTPARIGADEFAVLIHTTGPDEARAVAEHLLADIRRPVDAPGSADIVPEAYIGLAMAGTPDATRVEDTIDRLLRDADSALNVSRSHSPGAIVMFEPRLQARQARRRDLAEGLRTALDRGHLLLDYQPIVQLDDGDISGLEALLRWRDPERGVVSPAEFIPVAEDTGLIVPIGRKVLRAACVRTVDWQRRFPSARPLGVAVNVSPVQFEEGDVVGDVADALADSGLDPASLTVEVTESALRGSVDRIRDILLDLRGLGVKIAVDDFGTGYSSLAYLHELPVDVLKIDRTFIDGMRDGTRSPALIAAIVSIGHSLQLRTIAEGIEDVGQLEQSRALQCDAGQGYLFSRPGRGVAIEALLAARSRAVHYYATAVAS